MRTQTGWVITGLSIVVCVFLLHKLRESYAGQCSVPPQKVWKSAGNKKEPNIPVKPRFLVILAEARSGSTWLGSFFNQNERVLHFFEPLDERVIDEVVDTSKLTKKEITEIQLDILKNECTCQFRNTKYPSMGVVPSWSKSLHRLQGYLDENGKVIPKFRKPKSTDLAAKLKKQYPPDLGEVETYCNELDLRSAKVIRMDDIGSLLELEDLGCANFKVLHLIRDPRPIIQSRMNTFGELHTGNTKARNTFGEAEIRAVAKEICSRYLQNIRKGLSERFTGRYKFVRYEDIASDPVAYSKQIYDYVGLEFTSEIKDYIVASSSGSIVDGKYEVIRDTAEVVNHWKDSMSDEHARAVEEECSEMFRTFSYHELAHTS